MVNYGVEVWGWKEREKMERLQERYLRWLLGVDRRTPEYMVREEMQRELLREVAGVRVIELREETDGGQGGYWQGNVGRKGESGRVMGG